MTRDDLETLARRWMSFWQGADLSGFTQVHAPDFIDRASAGRPRTREAFRDSVAALYAAFPDFHARIDDLVIDPTGPTVAVRWSAEAVQTGVFMGCPPTGRPVRFVGVEIIRCRRDQVIERWGEWNAEELIAQLSTP